MDSMGFEIRRAVPADAPAIQKITLEAFQKYVELSGIRGKVAAQTESLSDIEADIRNKEVYIAFVDGLPVGSARVEYQGEDIAYFSRFGVLTTHQNNGVGKALLNIIDKRMVKKGIKRLELHTASKFFSLMRFYYGRGFYVESTSKDRGYVRALLVKEY